MSIRHLIFIIIIIILTFIVSPRSYVSAVTSTPSATTFIDKLKQIEILKEKIATKVAELRQKEKGGISGSVKSVNDTTITLTLKSKELIISFAEDTVFFKMRGGTKSDPLDSRQAKKLKPDDQIAAFGYFDSTGKSFSTKYIYIYYPSIHIIGKIADKDAANYTVAVSQPKGSTIVDIENFTKIYAVDKNTGLVRSGFSKLKENDPVNIFATVNPKEENRVSAMKLIRVASPETTSSPSATPSVKIKVTSPSATTSVK